MKLYNTLTRKVEEVNPLNPPEVTIYTCGPTVYDYAHVGHWFNYVRMDTLVRTLRLSGLNPKWVLNVTDVGHLVSDADEGEDKLEKGAKREGKSAWEIADFYTQDFLNGMDELNISTPDYMPKATEHINEQIELIKRLQEKGYTYKIDDGIYFDTGKFAGYAAFAGLDLDEQQEGARIAINPQKKNQSDFALWKFSPKDRKRDMEWDSPWGKGFPGWHIECSAMSMKYLGETLDIHTGGIDHIPVHHTNEIAQSESATGKRFANMWMHSNHVTIKGEKISKSLGNTIRLQDVIERGITPMALRLHVLESHYRSHSTFSWESLEAAQNRLKDIQAFADLRWQAHDSAVPLIDFFGFKKAMTEALENDLKTPEALATLSEIEQLAQANLINASQLSEFNDFLSFLDEALGLGLNASADINPEQKQSIAEREKARANKDWNTSDKLRDELLRQGIRLRDTPAGTVWARV